MSPTTISQRWKNLLLCGRILTMGIAVTMFAHAAPALAQAYPEPGVIMAADWGLPGVRISDPDSGSVIYDFRVDKQEVEGCNKRGIDCFPIGYAYANHDDRDYIDVAYNVINTRPRKATPSFYSVVARARATERAETVWTMRELNFATALDGDKYCPYDPADPCGAFLDNARCTMSFTHGFDVIHDDPATQTVTVIATDPNHSRVLQATLNYADGNTCADVDWVLGTKDKDWPAGAFMNGVDYIEADDGRYMVTTFYTASATINGGSPLIMWKWDGAEWQQQWRFPDPAYGDEALLNTPHMGEVLVDPLTNSLWVWYSHSRGLATDWAVYNPDGYAGTWGVLEPGATLSERPQYIADLTLFPQDEDRMLRFSRDQDYLSDGTMMLTDAACEDECSHTPRIYRTEAIHDLLPTSSLGGYYTENHEQLEVIPIPEGRVLDTHECGYSALFEADFVPVGSLGADLRAAYREGGSPCPN